LNLSMLHIFVTRLLNWKNRLKIIRNTKTDKVVAISTPNMGKAFTQM